MKTIPTKIDLSRGVRAFRGTRQAFREHFGDDVARRTSYTIVFSGVVSWPAYRLHTDRSVMWAAINRSAGRWPVVENGPMNAHTVDWIEEA